MSEIPADIIALADHACNECYDSKTSTWFNVRDIIALAILAEREACAKIAEEYTKPWRMNDLYIRNIQDESLVKPCSLADSIRRR